jgi:hypothetical protein
MVIEAVQTEVEWLQSRRTVKAMHAQRPADIGNRGAKDMLALEDLQKLFPSDWGFCNFLGTEAKP